MKLSKSIKLGAAASVMALTLAGCGASPKEDFTEAYKNLADVKSYEYQTDISLTVVGNTVADPEAKEVLDLLDSIKISSHGLVDNEKLQTEQNLTFKASVSPIQLTLDLSLFSDLKKGTHYVKAADLLNLMNNIGTLSGFPLNFDVPEELKDALIQIETPDVGGLTEKQTEDLAKTFASKFNTFLDKIPAEEFTKEDNVYTLKLDGEQIKPILLETIEEYLTLVGGDAAELEEIEKVITIGEIVVVSTIKDGNVVNEEIKLPLELKNEDGETIDLEVEVDSKYKGHNQPVKFTVDPEKDTVLTQDEFSGAMSNSLFPTLK